MNEIADRLFQPFSRRLGLASVREYEEQHQQFEARAGAEKARLAAQVRAAWARPMGCAMGGAPVLWLVLMVPLQHRQF